MASTYEFWLLDDSGRRITLLTDYAFFSYSRSVRNFGVIQMGFPYAVYVRQVNSPIFSPDWRIDVWRSPGTGIPMRREQTYLLRKYAIYTRETDDVQMIVLHGRDPKDLLNRRYIIQPAGYAETRKTDFIDDMMKEIVREQMLYNNAENVDGVVDPDRAWPVGEFLVQGNLSLGPEVTQNFADRNVLDTLRELSETSLQLHVEDELTNRLIYFDVVPYDLQGVVEAIQEEADPNNPILDEMGIAILDETSLINKSDLGFRFITIADLYGEDRTAGLVFSVENNNLEGPYFSKSHLEERNTVIVKGFGRGDSREWDEVADDNNANASRWNRCETFVDASSEPDQANLADYGYAELFKGDPQEEISAVFLNTPGSDDTPRSLYGMDWDLGDLLPVLYAEKQIDVEVLIVYVAIDENGVETITGRNEVNAAG